MLDLPGKILRIVYYKHFTCNSILYCSNWPVMNQWGQLIRIKWVVLDPVLMPIAQMYGATRKKIDCILIITYIYWIIKYTLDRSNIVKKKATYIHTHSRVSLYYGFSSSYVLIQVGLFLLMCAFSEYWCRSRSLFIYLFTSEIYHKLFENYQCWK